MQILVPEKAISGLNVPRQHPVPGLAIFSYLFPARPGITRLLILEPSGQVPSITKPKRARLEMSAHKRQQVSLRRVVGDRRRGNRQNGKVGSSIDNMAEYQTAPFSAGDDDEVVASRERE